MAIKGHTYLSEPVAKSGLSVYELSEAFILSIYASIYYPFILSMVFWEFTWFTPFIPTSSRLFHFVRLNDSKQSTTTWEIIQKDPFWHKTFNKIPYHPRHHLQWPITIYTDPWQSKKNRNDQKNNNDSQRPSEKLTMIGCRTTKEKE